MLYLVRAEWALTLDSGWHMKAKAYSQCLAYLALYLSGMLQSLETTMLCVIHCAHIWRDGGMLRSFKVS